MGNRGPGAKGGARRGLRHDGRAGEGRKKKAIQSGVEKAAGGRTHLYTQQNFGTGRLGDSDDIPGGKGGHEVAKPEGVIHRNPFFPPNLIFPE